jgi:hypothetical protein
MGGVLEEYGSFLILGELLGWDGSRIPLETIMSGA